MLASFRNCSKSLTLPCRIMLLTSDPFFDSCPMYVLSSNERKKSIFSTNLKKSLKALFSVLSSNWELFFMYFKTEKWLSTMVLFNVSVPLKAEVNVVFPLRRSKEITSLPSMQRCSDTSVL